MLLKELDDICFMIVGDGDPSYTSKLKSMVPKDLKNIFLDQKTSWYHFVS